MYIMYINEKNHLVWIHFFSLAEWLYGYNNYRECTMNRFSFTFFSLSSFTDNVKYIKPSLWSKGAIAISYIVTIKSKIVAIEQLSCFLHTSIVNVKYVSSFTSEPWWFCERDTWRSHILEISIRISWWTPILGAIFDVQDKSWVVETNYHIPENKEPQRKWGKFKAVVFVKKT